MQVRIVEKRFGGVEFAPEMKVQLNLELFKKY